MLMATGSASLAARLITDITFLAGKPQDTLMGEEALKLLCMKGLNTEKNETILSIFL